MSMNKYIIRCVKCGKPLTNSNLQCGECGHVQNHTHVTMNVTAKIDAPVAPTSGDVPLPKATAWLDEWAHDPARWDHTPTPEDFYNAINHLKIALREVDRLKAELDGFISGKTQPTGRGTFVPAPNGGETAVLCAVGGCGKVATHVSDVMGYSNGRKMYYCDEHTMYERPIEAAADLPVFDTGIDAFNRGAWTPVDADHWGCGRCGNAVPRSVSSAEHAKVCVAKTAADAPLVAKKGKRVIPVYTVGSADALPKKPDTTPDLLTRLNSDTPRTIDRSEISAAVDLVKSGQVQPRVGVDFVTMPEQPATARKLSKAQRENLTRLAATKFGLDRSVSNTMSCMHWKAADGLIAKGYAKLHNGNVKITVAGVAALAAHSESEAGK